MLGAQVERGGRGVREGAGAQGFGGGKGAGCWVFGSVGGEGG